MKKIGQFIYPWGNGHYSRMMRLNDSLNEKIGNELETHFLVKEKFLKNFTRNFLQKKKIYMKF